MSKKTIAYRLLEIATRCTIPIYYRKISMVNADRIPDKGPIILTPNHQNSFLDPVILGYRLNRPVNFLVRSDAFSSPFIISFLNLFNNMIPVYRPRDGKDKMERNKEIFAKCHKLLADGGILVIFVEGSHHKERRLRDLKKGFARIAFGAEEEYDYKLDIKIIPVGLEYSDHPKAFTNVKVSYGHPIPLSEYYEASKKDLEATITELKGRLAGEIKKEMVNIQPEEHYDLYNTLIPIARSRMLDKHGIKSHSPQDYAQIDQKTAGKLEAFAKEKPERIPELSNKTEAYTKGLEALKIKDGYFDKPIASSSKLIFQLILMLIGFPIWLYGMINHYVYYILPEWVNKKYLKDPCFHSSIRYTMWLLTWPIFYLIQGLLVWLISGSGTIAAIYTLSLPIFGWLALQYSFIAKDLFASLRYRNLWTKEKETMQELQIQREALINSILE